MGAPSSPLFADSVMQDLEVDCLRISQEQHNILPKFYYRYVDNKIICVHKEDLQKVVEIFNSYDPNLKFT